jgi:hypothetical protein
VTSYHGGVSKIFLLLHRMVPGKIASLCWCGGASGRDGSWCHLCKWEDVMYRICAIFLLFLSYPESTICCKIDKCSASIVSYIWQLWPTLEAAVIYAVGFLFVHIRHRRRRLHPTLFLLSLPYHCFSRAAECLNVTFKRPLQMLCPVWRSVFESHAVTMKRLSLGPWPWNGFH